MTLATFIKTKSLEAEAEGLEPYAVRFLICEQMGLDLSMYALKKDESLSEEDYNKLNTLVNRFIINHEPVQYILGYTYFLGRKFYVGPGCLIPRLDSECVVLEAEKYINNNPQTHILDMCCGSGIMGLTLKLDYPNTQVTLCDISEEALAYATQNQKLHKVHAQIIQSDLFSHIHTSYDVIISNPPYIAYDDTIDSLVKNNEPALALYAEDKGLYFYKKLIDNIPQYIKEGGYLILEIDPRRLEGIKGYLNTSHYYNYQIVQDNGGRARVCIIKYQK